MFIAVEGIDGSGKSTRARELAARLIDELGADRVVLTREPTELSPWGRRLRKSEREGGLPRDEEIAHFHKDRLCDLDEIIKPALALGKIVITDRYVDSTLAYQAHDLADAEALYRAMAPELIEPDLVLLLEIPIATALMRISEARAENTSFEREETLRRAAEIYASRRGTRYRRLDGGQAPQVVLEAALSAVQERLQAHN